MIIQVKLDCRKSGLTDKGYPIVVYAAANYKKKYFRTGYYAKKAEWNNDTSVPKSKHPEYPTLLDFVFELKIRINQTLIEVRKYNLGLSDVKELLFKKNLPVFVDAVLYSLPKDYKGTVWSAVNAFERYKGRLLFNEINKDTVRGFVSHLLAKGNKPGGVDSYIRSLRASWNRHSNEPNPFSGIKIEIPKKTNIVATTNDLLILENAVLPNRGKIGGHNNYRNYFLLMFYLGGIDPEVLSKLRYDKNVISGRVTFNRDKGRSKELCNNLIPEKAWKILNSYNCKPYFVPIYMSNSYETFSHNFTKRMKSLSRKISLSVELRPKSARYTFIDRAQQLLIDERITAQIVGHKRKTTTSLYSNDFPQSVQDMAHENIIKTS